MHLPRHALSALVLAIAASSNAHALDLAEAYEKARKNDPNWSAAQNNYEAEQASVAIGRGGLLPTLGITGSLAENSDEPETSGKADYTSTVLGAKLTQPLFRADAWYGYQRSKAIGSQAEAALRSQEQELALRVAQAYFAVLSAQETLAYAEAEESAFARQRDQAQQRFDVGLIAITDVLEARAAHDGARAGKISADAALSTAQENLWAIIGENPATRLVPLKADAPLVKPVPSDPDAWVNLARERNPELAAARETVNTAQASKREVKSAFLPAVDLFASYSDAERDPAGLINTNGSSFSYGIEANWTLFAGGRTWAASKQASYREAASRDLLTATERQVVNTARTAYLNVAADSYRVEARQQALASSESSLAAVEAGYEVGTRNIVDVLLSQRNLYAAKRDYAAARYDYVINSLRLKAASGQLSEVDIKQLNGWLDPNASIVSAPEKAAESGPAPVKKKR
ncbi:MAG: TolC family outer membrane protein [Moraxellaceae bacterium]|nr:TolC family outer membrane protein [Moraxellaceae bacterium]